MVSLQYGVVFGHISYISSDGPPRATAQWNTSFTKWYLKAWLKAVVSCHWCGVAETILTRCLNSLYRSEAKYWTLPSERAKLHLEDYKWHSTLVIFFLFSDSATPTHYLIQICCVHGDPFSTFLVLVIESLSYTYCVCLAFSRWVKCGCLRAAIYP